MREFTFPVVGEGKTAKIYRDGDKAIKLYMHLSAAEVNREAFKQGFAADAGLSVPKVYGVTEFEEGVGLIMEYIEGSALFRPRMDKAERNAMLDALVKLQCAVCEVDGEGLPSQRDVLVRRIGQTTYLDDDTKLKLLERLKILDRGKTNLCHGDFHPLNIMVSGDKYWIIDWVDANCGDPLADACRTYLIFKQHLTRLAGIYLRLYCKESGTKQEDVLNWLPIVAAGRLVENFADIERDFILDIIKTSIG